MKNNLENLLHFLLVVWILVEVNIIHHIMYCYQNLDKTLPQF
jgi:hypothetical protein